MADTKKTAKTAAATETETVQAKTKSLSVATSAIGEAGMAYVTGVSAVVKSVWGIGKEVASETVEHGKTSLKANCVRDLAEIQAGYVQHRIEASTVHVKTVADVAAENFTKVYAPLIGLLKDRKAA